MKLLSILMLIGTFVFLGVSLQRAEQSKATEQGMDTTPVTIYTSNCKGFKAYRQGSFICKENTNQ